MRYVVLNKGDNCEVAYNNVGMVYKPMQSKAIKYAEIVVAEKKVTEKEVFNYGSLKKFLCNVAD